MKYALSGMLTCVLAIACIVLLVVPPAFAAEAIANSTTVDFSPLLNQVIEFIAALLMVIAAWALMKLKQKFGLDIDAQMRDVIDTAVANGINYAKAEVEKTAAGKVKIDVHNEVIAKAADYAVAHAPDALTHFGVTPDALARRVQAALGAPA